MRNLVQNIVAITVAIIVFTAILIPIMGTAMDQTIDGEAHTAENTAPATYLDLYTRGETITITYDSATPSVTSNIIGLNMVVTSSKLITISGTTLTVTDSTGTRTVTEDTTITVPATGKVLVNTSATSTETATYGLYTSFGTPVYVEASKLLIAIDTEAPYIASEKYNGTAIGIASEPYEDHYDIYGITSVGTSGKLVAPLEYTWYDQIPAMSDTIKTILDILPILIVVGLLLTCVYMFFSRGGY